MKKPFVKAILWAVVLLSPLVVQAAANVYVEGAYLAGDSTVNRLPAMKFDTDNIHVIPRTADGIIGSSATDGVFNTATTTELCLAGDVCRTTWPSGGGSSFAWTPTTEGNSTSTRLIFGNGFISQASSTATGLLNANRIAALDPSATSTFAGGLTVDTSDFVVDPDGGRVGIGTASPTQKLNIVGNVDLTGNVRLGWNNGDSAILGGSGDYSLRFQTYTGSALTEKMVITSTGNVGIGTTTPAYPIDVNGDFRVGEAGSSNALFVDATNGYMGIGTNSLTAKLQVDNGGTVHGLRVNQSGTPANSTHAVFFDLNNTSGTAAGLRIDDENTSNQWASLSVQSERTGQAAQIDQNGNGVSLDIDSEASSANGINLDLLGTGTGLAITSGGLPASLTNRTDAASNQVLVLQGDRANPANSDTIYQSFKLSDSAGNQDEFARISAIAGVVTSTSESGSLRFSVASNGSLVNKLDLSENALRPNTNDSLTLGNSSESFSDLFLAPGGVINWNNGDVTQTHASNKLTWAGATDGYVFNDGNVGIGTTTPGSLLTVAGTAAFGTNGTELTIDSSGNLVATGTWDLSDATVKTHTHPAFSWPGSSSFATSTTATTTIDLGPAFTPEQWVAANCYSLSGTVGYRFTDGTNAMDYRTATTTSSKFSLSTNNTFTEGEKRRVEIGPMTNDSISCSVDKIVNN